MYGLAELLLRPHVLLCLAVTLALVRLWRRGGEGRRPWWLLLPFVGLLLLCLPVTTHLATGSLEWHYPPLRERPADAGAVVVLGGYVRPADSMRPEPELGVDTLYRCLKAAEVYHQGVPLPVLVSGGPANADGSGPTIAGLMRDFLQKLGVKPADLWVEDRSRTTHENAVFSCEILGQRGVRKIVLVTDAAHLPRALGCFRKQGVEAVPCGCRYHGGTFVLALENFLPDPSAARGFQEAWHEWFGLGWYWLRGRI
jgi:uncharacterized SAM-binding protein YcdF (DUF218 family)